MRKHLIFPFVVALCFIITGSLFSQTSRGMKIKVHTAAGQEIQLYEDSYALVIGNGNYTSGWWDPLDGALTDVEEVRVALEEHGFHVTLKKDLTKAKFDRAFAEFVLESGADVNNRLLFYYAGHGYTRESATGEDFGYLVMVDAPAPEDKVGFELESIPMESLVTQAEKILAKHALFIFDSCFSGTILNMRDRLIPPESISDRIKYPVRQFITAGRAGEVVPDHSDFKQAFLDLIEGREREPFQDGYITGEELGFYLKNQVPVYNPAQHPQYGKIRNPKLDKGDFVFVLPKEEVLPTVATLTVTSIPSGASVYIDGDLIGQTPLRDYKIDTGSQREKQIEVRLELSGYKNRVAQLTLRGGQQMPWDVRLEKFIPRTGTLTVTSTPSGADIYVDNTWIGKTPLTSYEVDTGVRYEKQVTVGLVLSGYKNHVAQLTLRGGQHTPMDVHLEKFIPRTGTLTVTSIPSGASVYIDGDLIGQTPLRDYEIDTGSQREKQIKVRLELSGYKNRVAQLTLRGGQHTPLDVRLEKSIPRTGTLAATSTPSGASVYVDGDLIGQTPLQDYEIDTGSQREKQVEVRLELSGYKSHVAKLTLRGGQQTPLDVRLEQLIPRTGTLTVTSTPSGASVYIDGDLIGQTPLHDYEIDTGSQREKQVEIRLELSGYKNRVAQLTLRGGQHTPLDVRLEQFIPQTGTLTVTSTPNGADIYVNNVWIGNTPLTNYEVDTGAQHEKQVTVGLVLSGYKNHVSLLTLKGGQHTPLDVRLEKFIPRTGTLMVTSTPSGASVYIDGDLIGQTPLHDYEIDTGSQREKQIEVRLELSGYKNRVAQLTLRGGQQTPLEVRLEKIPAPLDSAAPEDMVLIPEGKFQMGSSALGERPVHTVYVDAFYMDAHEVTNAQYKEFVDANPRWGKYLIPRKYHDGNYLKYWNMNGYPIGKGNHPVTYVSWYGAMAYAQWAGKRLPTEAEWEKAARGDLVGRKYPWGDVIDRDKANYDNNDTTPVGSYQSNGYGLYDMTGNVWEWCLDEYRVDYYETSPLRNPVAGANSIARVANNFTNVNKNPRVLRGGSWASNPMLLRASSRSRNGPSVTDIDLGFRCVRTVSP